MSSHHLQNLLYAFQRQDPTGAYASTGPTQQPLQSQQQSSGSSPSGAIMSAPTAATTTPPPSSLSNLSNLVQLIGRTVTSRPQQQAGGPDTKLVPSSTSSAIPAPIGTDLNESVIAASSSTPPPPGERTSSRTVPGSSSMSLGLSSLLRNLSVAPTSSNIGGGLRLEGPSRNASLPYPAAVPSAMPQSHMNMDQQQATSWGGSNIPLQEKIQQQPSGYSKEAPNPAPVAYPGVIGAGFSEDGTAISGDATILALGLIDSPFRSGSWRLDSNDIQRLISFFGPYDSVRLLSSLGTGGSPDCAIVHFSNCKTPEIIQRQLNNVRLPGHGRLVCSSFPASLLTGIRDEEPLLSVVLPRLRDQSVAVAGTLSTQIASTDQVGASSSTTNIHMNSVLDLLVDALTGGSGNALATALAAALSGDDLTYQSSSESVRAVVHAVKNDPALLPALQARLAAMESAKVSRPVPNLRKRVCRLELIDLFTFHPELDIPTLIVGADNSNIQYVLDEAKNKVDIELDGVPCNEAPVAERLHLTVTALDDEAYNTAIETLEDLLQSVCQQFTEFWIERKGCTVPNSVGFRRHEYREGDDGQLFYLGQTERPKPWLNTAAVSPPQHGYSK